MDGAIWETKFYAIGTWIYKLALVNLLWILFTLAGLVIFGFFPATVALFTVVRKWLMGDQEIPIFKTFIKTYRSEFIKGNLLSYIILAIGLLFFFDIKFFQGFNNAAYLLSYLFIFLFFTYCVMLLFVFPVYVHFKLSIYQYIKHAFLILLISPFRSILLLMMTFFIYYLTVQFSAIIIFFGMSVEALIIMWVSLKIFHKIEVKSNKLNVQKQKRVARSM